MDIEIKEDINNPLLKRRELVLKIRHDGPTPSRKSVVDKLAAIMNSMPGRVIVSDMKSEFGRQETIAYVKIYESEERARQVENAHIIDRNTFAEPAKETGGSKGAA